MVEMLTGTHPWPHIIDNFAFIYELSHLKDGQTPEFKLDTNVSDDLKEFLRLAFTVNYEMRPTTEQLLLNSFVNLSPSIG